MNHLICIVGPTGIGKTNLSIALAKHFGCNILSCDSRQFYKEMKIGTAVPEDDELQSVKHHFIQHISINNQYNVGQFEKDAINKLDQLFKENPIQVMVGGSGLYINAVLYGLDVFPDVDPQIRENLNQILIEEGIEKLQQMLKELDNETYDTIELQNPHRVIRALEICMGSGEKYSSLKNKKNIQRNFVPIIIGLDAERKTVYERIEKRVDIMMEQGLLEEVKSLYPFKHLNALQTVGYQEIFDFLDNKITLDFAVNEIKKNSRRYAKRQNTWFKRNENIHWFDFQTDVNEIVSFIKKIISKEN